MNIYLYNKLTEDISNFDIAVNSIKKLTANIFISTENKRCFRELENIKSKCSKEDILVVGTQMSLGLNNAAIINQLEWFISKSINLVICNYSATYEYGVSQPMNKAVLNTILQSLLASDKNIIEISSSKRNNSGRNKMKFPDNWDELYEKWCRKEITSKDFIYESGLKKATFYNLLTEYKEIQEANEEVITRYHKAI